MKAILSMALILGFCGVAAAQSEKGDPVGTWKCEYKIGDMQRTSTLTITKDGDTLAGKMDWPDQKDEKIKDPKFKDGKLTFSAVRKIMDNTIPIDYTLTIDGDTFKGKGASEFGGQKREFDIEGKREKKEKLSPEAAPLIAVLKAVKVADAAAFKNAYSQRIREDKMQGDWEQNISMAQANLKKMFGEYNLTDFSFTFAGDKQTGKVSLSHKGQAAVTLAVIKEGDEWKLDER